MRKTWMLGLAGGVLLLVGVLAGTIFGDSLRALAAGTTPTATPKPTRADYCKLYEDTLAHDLGVSTDKLESANKDAAQKVLDQMAADGRITAAEKARLESKLQQYAAKPCAFVALGASRQALRGKIGQALAGSRSAIESAVAAKLHISPDTLESDLAAGQTIPQIAQARKVQPADVNSAYLGAVKAQLDQVVSGGKITQDQANQIYQKVQQAVQHGRYPLLEAKKQR
jgi:polyhydroxyalkanoate synthesis regulator phasin